MAWGKQENHDTYVTPTEGPESGTGDSPLTFLPVLCGYMKYISIVTALNSEEVRMFFSSVSQSFKYLLIFSPKQVTAH